MTTAPEISVQELQSLLNNDPDIFILDVRNQNEFDFCNIKGYLIPLNELATRLHELDPAKKIIIHCHAGGRSRKATEFLLGKGFKNVFNLRGGITAWANEIDTSMPTY